MELFDHFVLERAGRWHFVATPGTYALAVFEDATGNLTYEPSESALAVEDKATYAPEAGEARRNIDLVIPGGDRARIEGPVDIGALQARTIHDKLRVSFGLLGVAGDIVDLSDPRFRQDNAEKGVMYCGCDCETLVPAKA